MWEGKKLASDVVITVKDMEIPMYKKLLLGTAFLASTATVAAAQDTGFYLGAGVAVIDGGEQGFDLRSTNLNLMAGYEVSPFFAIEGEASIVLSEDSVTIGGVTGDVGLRHAGIFARLNLMDSSNTFVPYLRAGWAQGTAEVEVLGVSVSDDDTAFAYGIGGEYRYNEKGSVRLDISKADFDTVDATIVSIGNVWRF